MNICTILRPYSDCYPLTENDVENINENIRQSAFHYSNNEKIKQKIRDEHWNTLRDVKETLTLLLSPLLESLEISGLGDYHATANYGGAFTIKLATKYFTLSIDNKYNDKEPKVNLETYANTNCDVSVKEFTHNALTKHQKAIDVLMWFDYHRSKLVDTIYIIRDLFEELDTYKEQTKCHLTEMSYKYEKVFSEDNGLEDLIYDAILDKIQKDKVVVVPQTEMPCYTRSGYKLSTGDSFTIKRINKSHNSKFVNSYSIQSDYIPVDDDFIEPKTMHRIILAYIEANAKIVERTFENPLA
jgi:hypothetical protein|tara:strand:+ start:13 stop:909 length:897 start_codon:yes stop_codon:yes gene_type:complete